MKIDRLRKLVRLRSSDWVDLFAAQAALLRAQVLVWTRRRGALVTPLAERPAPASPPGEAVRRSALAIARAAEHGLFRPTCLVRAVALHRMLQRRGFPGSSLRVGVRQTDGRLFAHAWVEFQGEVLADDAWHVKRFDPLARLGLSGVR